MRSSTSKTFGESAACEEGREAGVRPAAETGDSAPAVALGTCGLRWPFLFPGESLQEARGPGLEAQYLLRCVVL